MADRAPEHNNVRPHYDTGEIGDTLNNMSDQQYWACYEAWYQKPESRELSFAEYVRRSDESRREQARYDEANAARGRTSMAAPPQLDAHYVRSESQDSELSDDSLYRAPSPRHDNRVEPQDSRVRRPNRFEVEALRAAPRETEMATIHAVTPARFETDAFDDEALARLLANPTPEMLHQIGAASPPPNPDALDDEALANLLANPPREMFDQAKPMPGALDDEGFQHFLAQQQEEIFEGGWRDIVKEPPSADHLDDEALERFLANERYKVRSGETESFANLPRHPDALDDEELAKIIGGLGFEHKPLVQPERGESSRPRPTRYPPQTPEPPTYVPESRSNDERLYREQMAKRRRRMEAVAGRQQAAEEAERLRDAETVKEGKQPERYYE